MHAEFVTIATAFNKKGKNNIFNVKILIFNLIPIEASIKDPTLKVRTAKFSGNTGNIQIAVFDSLINKIKEDNTFLLTNKRVFTFESDCLIKSTNERMVTSKSDNDFEILEDGNRLVKQLLYVNISSVFSLALDIKLCKSVLEAMGII